MVQGWVLSAYQLAPLLALRGEERLTRLSLDLGLTEVEVGLQPQGIVLPSGQLLPWEAVEEIVDHPSVCFLVEESEGPRPIQVFSEYTNRFYGLMPTEAAGTCKSWTRRMAQA